MTSGHHVHDTLCALPVRSLDDQRLELNYPTSTSTWCLKLASLEKYLGGIIHWCKDPRKLLNLTTTSAFLKWSWSY